MKKVLLFILLIFAFFSCGFTFFGAKKPKTELYLSASNPLEELQKSNPLVLNSVFKKGDKVFFLAYNPKGFKSNYIKYQIVKQDDKAHVGGYSRIRNVTVRVKNKTYYCDYFVLNESGKYILQIFDIENLHQWLTYGEFRIVD